LNQTQLERPVALENPGVKITIGGLLAVGPAIRKLAQQDLPAHIAFRIHRLMQKLEPELRNANEQRMKVFRAHGNEGSDGSISIPSRNSQAFLKELAPLLETEISVPGIDPLPLAMLERANISAAEMGMLESLQLLAGS